MEAQVWAKWRKIRDLPAEAGVENSGSNKDAVGVYILEGSDVGETHV